MTVLIDNVAEEPLAGEWGLSILIIADGRKILLDTGSSGLFARNADCLGIDLGSVDKRIQRLLPQYDPHFFHERNPADPGSVSYHSAFADSAEHSCPAVTEVYDA